MLIIIPLQLIDIIYELHLHNEKYVYKNKVL